MSGLRELGAAFLIALGCAWPFAAHALAMTRLYPKLLEDPRRWLAYALFAVLLPCPALLYSGFILYLKPRMPFPARAVVSAIASAALFLGVSAIFALAVGGVGFTLPF
ncbi:MAG: hypothetical protein HY554_01970 [Elusimicrobia bacterium]|nr:hypothetical protein [Elusimicrobiota bacterium]